MMKTGFIPSQWDSRDYLYTSAGIIEESVDLRKYSGTLHNQGQTGSCAANATATAIEVLDNITNENNVDRSRLFLYYKAREYLAREDRDEGSTVRDNFRAGNHFGVPTENLMPFDVAKVNNKPTEEVYKAALGNHIVDYMRIPLRKHNTIELMKNALSNLQPIVIGMGLTKEFGDLSKQDSLNSHNYKGADTEADYVYYHAMCIVGYRTDGFIVENSWGSSWADGGYWLCPFEVMLKDTTEIWTVKKFGDIKRSKIYLEADEDFICANSYSYIFGKGSNCSVSIQEDTYGLIIDSSVSRIYLPMPMLGMVAKQEGISLEIYTSGHRLITTLQSPTQKLYFNGVNIPITYSGGKMTVNGRPMGNGEMRYLY